MISTLFIRSYERGERVYAAMLARGYDGLVRTFQLGVLKLEDWGFVFLLVALPLTVRIFTV
jgi:cobalt/nickel transport system permease protein